MDFCIVTVKVLNSYKGCMNNLFLSNNFFFTEHNTSTPNINSLTFDWSLLSMAQSKKTQRNTTTPAFFVMHAENYASAKVSVVNYSMY